jgi:hypothetical protein
MKTKTTPIIALAVAAGLALSGCADDGAGVASLRESPSPSGSSVQLAAATDMVTCLAGSGIDAESVDLGGGLAEVVITTEEYYRIAYPGWAAPLQAGGPPEVGPPGLTAGGEPAAAQPGSSLEQLEPLWEEFSARQKESGGPSRGLLYIGEKDHSAVFANCLDQSGFTPPELPVEDPASELKSKQAAVEAGVSWARCARENGYPQIQDPAPAVADGGKTFPCVWGAFHHHGGGTDRACLGLPHLRPRGGSLPGIPRHPVRRDRSDLGPRNRRFGAAMTRNRVERSLPARP